MPTFSTSGGYPSPPGGNDDYNSGSVISSSETNGNFDALKNHLDSQFVDDAVIADQAISGAKITDGTLDGAAITPGTLTGPSLAPGSITTTELLDGGVQNVDLAADAVQNNVIVDNTIDGSKVSDGSIGPAKLNFAIAPGVLPPNSVSSVEIVDGSIAAIDLDINCITTDKILDGNVTLDKLAADSVDASKIVSGSIGQSELGTDSVGAAQIQAGAVGNAEIAANAVGTSELADGVVTTGKYAVKPVVKAYVSGSFVHTTSGTFQAVSFNAEEFDTAAMHDNGVSPTRITAPIDGYYQVNAGVEWTVDAFTDSRIMLLRVNSLTQYAKNQDTADANGVVQTTGTLLRLNAGDYVQLMVFQGTGGAKTIDGGLESTWIDAEWVGPLV